MDFNRAEMFEILNGLNVAFRSQKVTEKTISRKAACSVAAKLEEASPGILKDAGSEYLIEYEEVE